MYMTEVTTDDIRLALLVASKKSSGLYNTVNMLFKNIFNSAERSQVLDYDPSENISAKGGKQSKKKEALTDEQALSLIETVESDEKQVGNKKTIVNIGTLSRFYTANEVVNLDTLKTKKIVSKDTGYVKILASGVLDKPLIVEANSYSIDAVKMILLTGGKVIKK